MDGPDRNELEIKARNALMSFDDWTGK